jgi:hypothetical protein
VGDDGYRHDRGFDDVRGADVGHTRTVVWQDQLTTELAELQATEPLFAAPGILGAFSRVRDTSTLLRLAPLVARCEPRAPRARPRAPRVLTPAELGQALTDRGLASAERVVAAIERLRRLLGWYAAAGETSGRPHETEVVAYAIAPLLHALGWSEEQVGIGCLRIPLAVFAEAPNGAGNCVLVAEGRELRFQLGDPREFAARRIRDGKLDACQLLMVARGGQFYVYRRDADGGWPDAPAGYVDVERLLTGTALPAMDAVEVLIALAPMTVLAEWAGRSEAARAAAVVEPAAVGASGDASTLVVAVAATPAVEEAAVGASGDASTLVVAVAAMPVVEVAADASGVASTPVVEAAAGASGDASTPVVEAAAGASGGASSGDASADGAA